jgi:DHA1 family bicyclomycin/chloramphenicol resistance-like MFS transporter
MLGPFSVDTYLPAFSAMAESLDTSQLKIQQTLTVYLFAFAAMSLWHGALSDALGRKPVIVVTLAVYAVASVGCAIAGNVESLVLFRVLQGLSAGGGWLVGRAIVRDRFHGPEAQRLMSRITLMFAIAPAIAPIVGGWLLAISGWRSIFWALFVFTAALLVWVIRDLRETHPVSARQSLRPRVLWANYVSVFMRREFQLLAGMVAFNFAGFFLYIPAAPVFLMQHLRLSPQDFGWMFVPSIAGMMTGAMLSGRLAERLLPAQTIWLGFGLMGFAAVSNVALAWALPPSLPWSILPLPLYSCGMSLVMPSSQLMLLDLFPSLRGLASSLQGFTHTLLSGIVAGAVAPALEHSTRALAGGMLGFVALGFIYWMLYLRWLPERQRSA